MRAGSILKDMNLLNRLFYTILTTALLACSGCVIQQHGQDIDKVTVAGLELAPGSSGLSMATYSVRFGLVRHEYIHNETSTNPMYAAPLSATSTASLSIMSQSASETISSK